MAEESKRQAKALPADGAGDPIADAGQALFNDALRWQEEVARFMQERLKRNMECCESLLSCREPTEALEVQSRFASAMVEDYVTETHKLIDIAANISRDGFSFVETSTRHAVDYLTRRE